MLYSFGPWTGLQSLHLRVLRACAFAVVTSTASCQHLAGCADDNSKCTGAQYAQVQGPQPKFQPARSLNAAYVASCLLMSQCRPDMPRAPAGDKVLSKRQVNYSSCYRCGRIWRRHAHSQAAQRSTGAALASLTAPTPLTHPPAPLPQPAASVSSLPLLESGALISALLLNPTHESVRSLAVSLLKQLCLGTPHMTIRLVSRLAALLPQASTAGERFLPMHRVFSCPCNACKLLLCLLVSSCFWPVSAWLCQ